MRSLQLFAALLILIGTFVLTGETSQACGCIPAMSEAELAPYKAKAERGDIEAVETVWFEYRYNGAPASRQRLRYWRSKAILLAAPIPLQMMADDWLNGIRETTDIAHKRLFADTAVVLLNRAYHNREHLSSGGWFERGTDEQAKYAALLRTAVGVQAVLREGTPFWHRRANAGDTTAAHHLTVYYAYATQDEKRRDYWSMRASEWGDPDFAGAAFREIGNPDDIRDIRRALRSDAPVHRIPNRWIRRATLRAIEARLADNLNW